MKAKQPMGALLLLPLLALVLGTACQGPPDPRMRHAHESEEWQAFDANLDILYSARDSMRESILLPPQPRLSNDIEKAVWAAAVASEQSRLADLIHSEALNDLAHCKQAVRLAEEQVEAARARRTKMLEELGPAVKQFMQAFERGKVEQNRRALQQILAQLPEAYNRTFLSLVDQR